MLARGHSEPGEVQSWGDREGKKKDPYDAYLQTGACSMMCLLLLLKSL